MTVPFARAGLALALATALGGCATLAPIEEKPPPCRASLGSTFAAAKRSVVYEFLALFTSRRFA